MPKLCESPREWRSLWEGDNSWVGKDRSRQGSLSVRIAACKDICLWGLLPARIAVGKDHCLWGLLPATITEGTSRYSKCGKNCGSMCCHALCRGGYGMDAEIARWQDCHFSQRTSLLHKKCRVKPKDWETESVPNRNKTKSKSVLTYTAVF